MCIKKKINYIELELIIFFNQILVIKFFENQLDESRVLISKGNLNVLTLRIANWLCLKLSNTYFL